jgi:hypothetical protein
MNRTCLKKGFLAARVLFCMSLAGLASASVIGVPIDNTGWYVSLDNPSGIGSVDFFYDGVDDNNIRLELVKEFNSPNFDQTNQGDGLFLKFTLVDPCAPNFRPNIVIWDERIINNTGRDWTDFHIILGTRVPIDISDLQDGPGVGFDPGYIFTPTQYNPFQTIVFNPAAPTTNIDMKDGILLSNGMQYVFGGAGGGHLRIVTDLPKGESFWFKEFPTVPEVATIILLALGSLPLIFIRRTRTN